jgi:hypothetical protein
MSKKLAHIVTRNNSTRRTRRLHSAKPKKLARGTEKAKRRDSKRAKFVTKTWRMMSGIFVYSWSARTKRLQFSRKNDWLEGAVVHPDSA